MNIVKQEKWNMAMTREDMLTKLGNINICVANITYTDDVGLFFDVISSEGVGSEQGYNFSQWPCFKYPMTNKVQDLLHRIKDGEEIDDDELLSNEVFKEICTIHCYNDSFLVCDDTLTKCTELIRKELGTLSEKQDSFYAYVSIENWSVNVKFFSTYNELANFFKDECNHFSFVPWSEMTDEKLKGWYCVAEENDWDGIPYMDFSNKQ